MKKALWVHQTLFKNIKQPFWEPDLKFYLWMSDKWVIPYHKYSKAKVPTYVAV